MLRCYLHLRWHYLLVTYTHLTEQKSTPILQHKQTVTAIQELKYFSPFCYHNRVNRATCCLLIIRCWKHRCWWCTAFSNDNGDDDRRAWQPCVHHQYFTHPMRRPVTLHICHLLHHHRLQLYQRHPSTQLMARFFQYWACCKELKIKRDSPRKMGAPTLVPSIRCSITKFANVFCHTDIWYQINILYQ